MSTKKAFIILVITLITFSLCSSPMERAMAGGGGTLYVDENGTAGNNCSSWALACPDLQTAIDLAADEIWVAEGVYKPSLPAGRDATFALTDGLEIYGGFPRAGGDGTFDARDPWLFQTTLNGNIGNPFNHEDDCYHVVTAVGTSPTTILDGFTITSGNANGTGYPRNSGGGMLISNGGPFVRNTVFTANHASGYGGGLEHSNTSHAGLENVIFHGNTAGIAGGGIDNILNSTVYLVNGLLSSNHAPNGGGVSNLNNSTLNADNATIGGNEASVEGGGVYIGANSHAKLDNSILWGNLPNQLFIDPAGSVEFDHGLVQGGCPVSATCPSVIDENPLFVRSPDPGEDDMWGTYDDDYGDLRLMAGSPAINAGVNEAIPGGIAKDLMGNPRIANGPEGSGHHITALYYVDLGAYEAPPARVYVDVDASGADNGYSWQGAFNDLQDGLLWGRSGPTEVWVTEGEYKPGTSRGDTFELLNNVAVFGGFPNGGGDGSYEAREWLENVTILSGDIGVYYDTTDNSYHVVSSQNTDSTAILDGFSIRYGNAGIGSPQLVGGGINNHGGSLMLRNLFIGFNKALFAGGGMYNSGNATLTNVGFHNNEVVNNGGGLYNIVNEAVLEDVYFYQNKSNEEGGGVYNDRSTTTFTEVTFYKNEGEDGGGMYNRESSPTLEEVFFLRNTAELAGGGMGNSDSFPSLNSVVFHGNSSFSGGGMENWDSNPKVTNTIFSGNTAVESGAVWNDQSNPSFTNVTFAHNKATVIWGAMGNFESDASLTNVIFWGNTAPIGGHYGGDNDSNPSIQYTILPDGCPPHAAECVSLTSDDPLFMHPPDIGADGTWGTMDDDYGDLRLMDTSPAIDAGDNNAVVAILYDLPGNPRLADVTGVTDTGNGTAPIVDLGAYENPPIRLYADHTAMGAGSGLSWTDAYTEAMDAVARGLSGPTEIWVAAGNYTPGGEREDTFMLLSGMNLYGGFPNGGGGGSFGVRDWENYPTTLSGEIGDLAKTSDNSYQVMLALKAKGSTVVDGFTIQDGNADGDYHAIHGPPYIYMLAQRCTTYKKIGGGLCSDESDITLGDMIFRDNYGELGGGIYHQFGSLVLDAVTFEANASDVGGGIYNALDELDSSGAVFRNNTANYGGGIFTQDADVDLVNMVFEGNTTEWGGGGMYFSGGNAVQLSNALFSGNLAQQNGGGAFIEQGSTITLTNTTFSGNQAIEEGGGFYNHQSEVNLANSVLWGNQAPLGEDVLHNGGTFTANYSLIKTGCPAAGVCSSLLTSDPLFQRAPDPGADGDWGTSDDDYGDLRLSVPSPAIDAGDNSAVRSDRFDLDEDGNTAESLPYDLMERSRFYDTAAVSDTGAGTAPIVDMGAYETSPYWIYLPMILR